MKRGFGLMEVLVAAVVLGFLLVGLNTMQKGNRESVLRIRARDAASAVAQEVIDSISALGSARVAVTTAPRKCPEPFDETHDLCRKRIFTGSASRQLKDTMNVTTQYSVTVEVKQDNSAAEDNPQIVNEETEFVKAIKGTSDPFNSIGVEHSIAKQVDVTVEWKFKNSLQSINLSSIVR